MKLVGRKTTGKAASRNRFAMFSPGRKNGDRLARALEGKDGRGFMKKKEI